MKDKKILIFSGGVDSERKISLLSGKNIWKNLEKDFNIFCVEVDKNKDWIFKKNIIKNKKKFLKNFDYAINIIHGKYGEDGQIQKIFEKYNFPFFGSGSKVSKITIDKNLSKKFLIEKKAKIFQANFLVLNKKNKINEKKIFEKIGKKVIVKPVDSGSSFGISVAKNFSELKKSIKFAFKFSDKIIIEEFIKGFEIQCGVFGYKNIKKSLPSVEIKYPGKEFFDFDAKYNKKSIEICPAKIPKILEKKIQKKAKEIFKIFGCKNFARVDFLVKKEKEKYKIYFIEINTIPGFTKNSLFPQELKATKISIKEFFKKIIIKELEK